MGAVSASADPRTRARNQDGTLIGNQAGTHHIIISSKNKHKTRDIPPLPPSPSSRPSSSPASREPKLVGKVNMCSGRPRPWWCLGFAEIQCVHGLLEKQLR